MFLQSTMHNNSADTVLKHPKGSHKKKSITCPVAIIDYNKYMGGVDLMDQYLSYYSLTTRRTLKWWKKIFWRFVDISIVNSWIIFRQNYPNTDIKSHILRLADELVQPLLDLRANPVVSGISEKHLVGKHFAYKGRKRERYGACSNKVVAATKKRKDTKTQNFCKKCDVFCMLALVLKCFYLLKSPVLLSKLCSSSEPFTVMLLLFSTQE